MNHFMQFKALLFVKQALLKFNKCMPRGSAFQKKKHCAAQSLFSPDKASQID